jgi:hypothetical protein
MSLAFPYVVKPAEFCKLKKTETYGYDSEANI